MLYDVLKTVHVLSIILWVGGMMFALWFMRPAMLQVEQQPRLKVINDAMGRFFKTVLLASLLVLVTGYWMLGRVAKQTVQAGASFEMPMSWWIMAVLGTLMVAIFMHIRFALYKRLRDAVQFATWDKAAAALAKIQTWVSVNLGLGLVIILAVYLFSA
jgi:uncharacterized membrane protein